MIIENLTIVFQGKIFKNNFFSTDDSVRKLLKIYPKLKIILSIWQGDLVSEFIKENCKIVFNNDPGKVKGWTNLKPNNVNRQIVSSFHGISNVETKYVLKLRTDCLVNLNKIIRLFNIYKGVNDDKVLISNLTTKNPDYARNIYYHFCDWIYFGKKCQVIKFFDIPLYDTLDYKNFKSRVAPEQHITFSWLKNIGIISSLHSFDQILNKKSQDEILSNFLILSTPNEIGLTSLKVGYFFMPFGKNGFLSYTKIDINNLRGRGFLGDSILNKFFRGFYYFRYIIIHFFIKLFKK